DRMRKIEFSAQREPVQFPLHPRLQCGGIHQAVVTVEVVAILRLSRPAGNELHSQARQRCSQPQHVPLPGQGHAFPAVSHGGTLPAKSASITPRPAPKRLLTRRVGAEADLPDRLSLSAKHRLVRMFLTVAFASFSANSKGDPSVGV